MVKIRLRGPVVSDYISEGVVQVEHEGKWGYICPSGWTSVNSYVLCGHLGFPNAEEQESYSVTIREMEPVYWLDQVTCKGWESTIMSCDHAGWGHHHCESDGVLKIKCTRRNEGKVSGIIYHHQARWLAINIQFTPKGPFTKTTFSVIFAAI